ncbi:hypothetical protein NDN08_000440 [Rhodosorus marinus]|uniref:Peptide-methionine (R)-S-oxide reductase n=1 Tax=Rhodosorus marinus TaxID=101924 RepID=A0AAV8UPF9_9RHOD|nr:hypothetical protein NDN08_000440 [Rhodosorus marinus]
MAFVVGGFTGLNGRSGARAVSRRAAGVVMMASSEKLAADVDLKKMSLKDWERVLTPEQFRVLRMKGTEYPGTGEYNKFFPTAGTFACAGCGNPLFDAETKFNSGSGWPAFYDVIEDNVKEVPDIDGSRIEILCNNCDGHLGHVFKNEGFPTPKPNRHCVNSACLEYREN